MYECLSTTRLAQYSIDIVPLGYSASFAKQPIADYFGKQAIGFYINIMKDVLRVVDLHELSENLVVVDYPLRPTVSHVTILHVESQQLTDHAARLIHRQLHVRARISTSLFSVVLPVWTYYQNCCYWLLWSVTSHKSDLITKQSQYWYNQVHFSSVNSLSLVIDLHWRWLAKRDHQDSRYMLTGSVYQWWTHDRSHINCPLTQC